MLGSANNRMYSRIQRAGFIAAHEVPRMSDLGRKEAFNQMVNCLATLVNSPARCGQL